MNQDDDFKYDPPFSIVKYLFIKKNIVDNTDSIESFFENGVSFPLFISMIFNTKEIPGNFKNPKTKYRKNRNNDFAFQFLLQNNKSIQKINPKYESKSDQINLLKLILIHQCFSINIPDIINKCNIIVKPLGISFKKKEELISTKCLTSILFAFNKANTRGFSSLYKITNIFNYNDIKSRFDIAHVPLVINRSSINIQNSDYFFIQLLIIFEFYSNTIENFKNAKSINFLEESESDDILISNDDMDIYFQYYDNKMNMQPKSDIKTVEKSVDNNIILQEFQEDSLLLSLNAISKGKFHFINLDDAIKNDSLPKFVLHLLNISSIENVEIASSTQKSKQKLTKKEINNINEVIKFIKEKEIKFKYLNFDFQNSLYRESSTNLFYTNLLNFFFIKESKQKMYERCLSLLCTRIDINKDYEDFYILSQYQIFAAILHVINDKDFHFKYDKLPKELKNIEPYFIKAQIPMILGLDFYIVSYEYGIPDSIFYQLQFIFNKIDEEILSIHSVEILLNANYKCKQIKVPKFDVFVRSQKAKQISLEFQHKCNKYIDIKDSQIVLDNSDEDKNFAKSIEFPKTFKDRLEINKITGKKVDQNEKIPQKLISSKMFWNCDNKQTVYEKGILIFNKSEQNFEQNQKNWENEISKIRNCTDKKTSTNNFHESSDDKTKLYKIFTYNEEKSEWHFKSKNFKQYLHDNKMHVSYENTPIILLFDSCEDELISLINYFEKDSVPNLHNKSDQSKIFIYSVGNIKFKEYIQNPRIKKAKEKVINPIFLTLHISESKLQLHNLENIVFQIYGFLSIISQINIVVLNKYHYRDQIKLIKIMSEMQDSYIKKIQDDENNSCSFSISMNEEEEEIVVSKEGGGEEEFKDNDIQMEEEMYEKIKYPEVSTKSQYILLIDDALIQCCDKVEEEIQENEFFKHITEEINDNVLFLGLKDSNSYIKKISKYLQKNFKKKYLHINDYFKSIYLSKLSNKYIQLRCKGKEWKENIKKDIIERFSQMNSIKNNEQNPFKSLTKLKNEILSFTPSFDLDVIEFCNSVLMDIRKKITRERADFYSSELEISSILHIEYLKKIINSKKYWSKDQIINIIKSHDQFLKDEFLSIIKLTSDDNIYNLIYFDNYNILDKQIKKDQEDIKIIFSAFEDKKKIKEQLKQIDIHQSRKKSTQYSIRETENLREIEVTVEVGKDLKSIIEQDF